MDATVESEEQKHSMMPSKRTIAEINGSSRASIKQTPEIKKRKPTNIEDDNVEVPV